MKKLKFTFINVLLLISISATSQSKNAISLSYGINNGYLKDVSFSPLHYQEKGSFYSLQYLRQPPDSKYMGGVNLDFSAGKVKTKASDFFTSNFIYAKISVCLLRKITIPKNNKLHFYTGLAYSTNLFYVEWEDNEAFSYVATHGLAMNFKTDFVLNERNQISSMLSIPFLFVLARPPYNGRDEFILANQNSPAKIFFHGKLATFNQYYGFLWQAKYHYTVTKWLNLSLNYHLNLQKVTGIKALIHVQNQLQTGINFTL